MYYIQDFQNITINLPYLTPYAYRIHKSWFNRSFGINMKHFTKQISSLYSLHGKKYWLYIKKKKIFNFLLKHLPPQNIVPHLMLIEWNFIAISFIGIVKPKFTRWNEIWCRILEIERAQNAGSNVLKLA